LLFKTFTFIFFFQLFCANLLAQNCAVPFNLKFENRGTTSTEVSWLDNNTTAPLGWELEIVVKGQNRTGLPSFPMVTQNNIVLTDLVPSTAYQLYIRTVCTNDKRSNWNVAIPFTTVIEIPSACKINIPLKDNGTEVILLDVQEKGILGKDIFLQSVDLIIEHDWPADLNITIESPQGQQLVLSNHNGIATDDFGDVLDDGCTRFTSFSPDACTNLKSSKPPYIGIFRPDGDISAWRLDTLSKGHWKLIIYDRALKDAGVLKYINLRFSKENCLVPPKFAISHTDIDSITLTWAYEIPCKSVEINIIENGISLTATTVQCNQGMYTFKGLLPNTEYEFSIKSRCSLNEESQESCTVKGATSCEPITSAENFENYEPCKEGCASTCNWINSVWYNVKDDSEQDWILWRGKTDTENTGPSGDITDLGKYLYIENNPQLCGSGNDIILQSQCMAIKSNLSGCDMSFYYHMYGVDITKLALEISLDDGQNWEEIFVATGNQGDIWKRVTLPLTKYDQQNGIFRFKASSADGTLGDIAIDQIEFYKSIPLSDLSVYYLDIDEDGYGDEASKIEICASVPPFGYVNQAGDCDDNNRSIHPNATEIQCNNIDENCNGNEDDQPQFNPIKITPSIIHASCNGSIDGVITLMITGGTAPYNVSWNDGQFGPLLQNLSNGVYFATITDSGGCVISTDFYQIDASTNLNIIITEMSQTSCKGKSDAYINIAHNIDHPPYKYSWSNGATTKNISNINDGNYTVTVTDANNCIAVKHDIIVAAKPSVLVDIKNIRHPLCVGQNTGSIELFTINGTPPYKYLWNNGQTTGVISQLGAGHYKCTVTDDQGCFIDFNAVIESPKDIEISILSTETVRCFGESTGSIKTNATGGTPPYTYLWNKLSERTDDIFNLDAGIYILTVTDANGCKKATQPIDVIQPPLFELILDSIGPTSCILGKNGYVSVLALGGNGGANYVWNHSEISSTEFNDLVSGNYTVTAYDNAGCKAGIPNVFIPFENIPLEIGLELLQDNACYNESNAIISAHIDGGKPTYDYNWSHGIQYFTASQKDSIKNLAAGIYQLTVTDADGCTGLGNVIEIVEKDPYYYSVQGIQNNVCHDDSTGIIHININGGTKPIGISWNGGLYAGSEINHLPNGSYSAQIIDAQNCILDVLPLSINSVSDMILSPIILDDVNGNGTGKICVNPTNGQAPYNIVWSNGAINVNCIENLKKGTYLLTITDALGCSKEDSFIVDNISSTEEQKQHTIKIYPNPASDFVHVISGIDILEMKIYDLNGNCLMTYTDLNNVIPIQNLIPGLYFLKFKTNNFSKTIKLVKR
jgi:subtilisin-like proprotein convertase family protein